MEMESDMSCSKVEIVVKRGILVYSSVCIYDIKTNQKNTGSIMISSKLCLQQLEKIDNRPKGGDW
jgi:hypothetical protein